MLRRPFAPLFMALFLFFTPLPPLQDGRFEIGLITPPCRAAIISPPPPLDAFAFSHFRAFATPRLRRQPLSFRHFTPAAHARHAMPPLTPF
jgi:hypothetical protein